MPEVVPADVGEPCAPWQLLRGRFSCPLSPRFVHAHQKAIIERLIPLRKPRLRRLGDAWGRGVLQRGYSAPAGASSRMAERQPRPRVTPDV
jgi:hypothetical protein